MKTKKLIKSDQKKSKNMLTPSNQTNKTNTPSIRTLQPSEFTYPKVIETRIGVKKQDPTLQTETENLLGEDLKLNDDVQLG